MTQPAEKNAITYVNVDAEKSVLGRSCRAARTP